MKTSTIEDLAYLIKQAHDQQLPKPIVFLGAGASKTGNIPLAREIVDHILTKYIDNPSIKKLKLDKRTYPALMDCLTPYERNELLKEYVNNAKINVTHIYLAQLINQGYIDYVLTVNFDNLMLRASALFNDFPPTYDMAVLKDLTTTNFKEKSVVYLHGQHHGLWLLNTEEELDKVRDIIPPILNKISNQRPWIFIGYSGEDPIFDHIVKLGRFDNGLYWVAYNYNAPSEKVCSNLLEKPNTNALKIEGYDSDSFMIKLSNELGLQQPFIIDKPFTSLKNSLDNIVDIDDKDHFKGVKERLKIAKGNVISAVEQFEIGNIDNRKSTEEINLNILKKRITYNISRENYDDNELIELEEKVSEINNSEINELLGDLFFNAANDLADLAELTEDEILYKQSFSKFYKATILNNKDATYYFSWGTVILNLAKLKNDPELYIECLEKFEIAADLKFEDGDFYYNWPLAVLDLAELTKDEVLYVQSFEKFEKASAFSQDKSGDTLCYWGMALSDFAQMKNDEMFYLQAFEKFKMAEAINAKNGEIYFHWGVAISNLAVLKNEEYLYLQSFEKFEKAISINPENSATYINWGSAITDLAKLKKEKILYFKSFEKFEMAEKLNGNDGVNFDYWGISMIYLSRLNNDGILFKEAVVLLNKAIELGGGGYNLACAYAIYNDSINALHYLEIALSKNEISIDFIENDNDWDDFRNDLPFIELLKRYQK